eukprot:TRINITY_DN5499_c0_g1_i1.p2 TRINITY_DN5499_c0_g1~~TRINITY_DN5499_c0_g1_i1.p2  ORF type:complete len:101 (-),score=3.44 TRINITY_DN5499_c0_g1_i1:71-373(-)
MPAVHDDHVFMWWRMHSLRDVRRVRLHISGAYHDLRCFTIKGLTPVGLLKWLRRFDFWRDSFMCLPHNAKLQQCQLAKQRDSERGGFAVIFSVGLLPFSV